MSTTIINLEKKGLINPPKWLSKNIVYLSIVGSVSYGDNDVNKISDIDLLGICVPPKSIIFPHLAGKIFGFDEIEEFNLYKKDHIVDNDKEYDISIRNIVSFFKLLNKSNPTAIESLFSSQEEVLLISQVGHFIRDNRHMFLSKECVSTFKGYSLSNLKKMESKTPEEWGKRYELVKKYGYDVKFAMHCVRLLLELEQILTVENIDLKKDKDQLKSIRKGEWTIDEIKKWASNKEKELDIALANSNLQEKVDEKKVKNLLIQCLEIQYGSLNKIIADQDKYSIAFNEIKDIIEKFQ